MGRFWFLLRTIKEFGSEQLILSQYSNEKSSKGTAYNIQNNTFKIMSLL